MDDLREIIKKHYKGLLAFLICYILMFWLIQVYNALYEKGMFENNENIKTIDYKRV